MELKWFLKIYFLLNLWADVIAGLYYHYFPDEETEAPGAGMGFPRSPDKFLELCDG